MILLFVQAGFDLVGGLFVTAIGLAYPLIAMTQPASADDPPTWAMVWLLVGLGLGACFLGAAKAYAGNLVRQGEGYGAALVANMATLVFGFFSCSIIHLGLGVAGLIIGNTGDIRAELEGWDNG